MTEQSTQQQPPEKRTVREITTGVETKAPTLSLQPRNFGELWDFAKMISETEFVPAPLKGKPGAVIAAIQYGNEVGLPPMTSLHWIAVINGAPSLWGDGYWMLIRSHPLCEWVEELSPEEALAKGYGECAIKRKGDPKPTIRRFTKEMARKAGLYDRARGQGPWATYEGRMLQMRARALCGRDTIPEATGPLYMREEAEDFEAIETTAIQVKKEPLKIPQAIKEEPNDNPTDSPASDSGPSGEPHPATVAEGGGQDAGKEGAALADNEGKEPAHAGAAAPGGDPTAQQTKPKKKAPAEVKEDILDWIKNRGSKQEILALNNYVTENIKGKGLSSNDLMEITKAWNARRKQLLDESKDNR